MKLSKQQAAEKAALVTKLQDAERVLDEKIDEFNAAVSKAWSEIVGQALADHKLALEEAKEFCEDIANDVQNYFDDKSEKWQEGDRGSAVQAMADEWSGVDLDQDEMDEPDRVDPPSYQHSNDLEGLPEEPSA